MNLFKATAFRSFLAISLAMVVLFVSSLQGVPGFCCRIEVAESKPKVDSCCGRSSHEKPQPREAPCKCSLDCSKWRFAAAPVGDSPGRIPAVEMVKVLFHHLPVVNSDDASTMEAYSFHDPPPRDGGSRLHLRLGIIRC